MAAITTWTQGDEFRVNVSQETVFLHLGDVDLRLTRVEWAVLQAKVSAAYAAADAEAAAS